MRRILLLLVGGAVLWGPAVSVAGDSSQSPSKPAAKAEASNAKASVSNPATTCQNRSSEPNSAASLNGRMFNKSYGTSANQGRGTDAAFGKCVSTIARHEGKSDNEGGPKSDGQAGAESDGTDSGNDQGQDDQGQDDSESDGNDSAKSHGGDRANPAMTCKTMEANDLAHFRTTYGGRPNAFGTCVAKHANSTKS